MLREARKLKQHLDQQHLISCRGEEKMGRWIKPEVYPLMAAMTFVSTLCVFQLARNVFLNPDVRINKDHRATAVLENAEEGHRYSQHGFRKFLSHRRPEVMPAINSFFSDASKN